MTDLTMTPPCRPANASAWSMARVRSVRAGGRAHGARGRSGPARQRGNLDVLGAALLTAGMLLLVYTIVEAPSVGWGAARTIAGFAVARLILARLYTIFLFITLYLQNVLGLSQLCMRRGRSLTTADPVAHHAARGAALTAGVQAGLLLAAIFLGAAA